VVRVTTRLTVSPLCTADESVGKATVAAEAARPEVVNDNAATTVATTTTEPMLREHRRTHVVVSRMGHLSARMIQFPRRISAIAKDKCAQK